MDPALKTMIENMPEKTGKSLDQWKSLLASKSFAKHSEAVNFLKKEHGVTHGYANTIVTLSKDEGKGAEDLVTAQYKGKEQLLPIYEKLLTVVRAFGPDVQVVPKKTTVSLVRKKQFALIKPATKTRIDLGLKRREHQPPGGFRALWLHVHPPGAAHRSRPGRPRTEGVARSRLRGSRVTPVPFPRGKA